MRTFFSWTMLTPGRQPFRYDLARFDLKRGRHKIRIRLLSGEFASDALMFTQTPKVFEEM